jgi:hypothetical protein
MPRYPPSFLAGYTYFFYNVPTTDNVESGAKCNRRKIKHSEGHKRYHTAVIWKYRNESGKVYMTFELAHSRSLLFTIPHTSVT